MPKIKHIYLHMDSHLREDGWLQGCFHCKSITGKYFLFNTFYDDEDNLLEFYVYLCPKCKKKINKSTTKYLDFIEDCNDYINYNFSHLFSGRA